MSSRSPELPLRALFQKRVAGDDALLDLARLRFAQAGLGAELYADTPGQLDHALRFVPAGLPTVHLGRGVNLLDPTGREVVRAFGERFAGRVWGMVVHDKREMATRTGELVAALGELGGPGRPWLLLEYAAGHDLGWFAELAERVAGVDRVSCCIDVGHVGVQRARDVFAAAHAGLDVAALTAEDPRLPELVGDVQDAVAAGLPAVLELVEALAPIGKPLHLHLHDGHPLVPGLSDHFGFLTSLPIPFEHEGRASLAPLYGPAGLAAILRTALRVCGGAGVSAMLEIHQAEGRRPLGDAAGLFGHWRDLTNAERQNFWLSVLAENAMLATAMVNGS